MACDAASSSLMAVLMRVHIFALGGFADFRDGRFDRLLIGIAELVALLLDELLELVGTRLGIVASFDEGTLLLVFVGVRIGVAAHLFDFAFRKAARLLDPHGLLDAGAEVFRRHAEDAVGVDVELDFDLAARRAARAECLPG